MRGPIALLSPRQMSEADRLTIAAGTPGIALMARAAHAVVEAVVACRPEAARIAVLAGPGNNGGDGFMAAEALRHQGYDVTVWLLGDPRALTGDAAEAAAAWQGVTQPAAQASFGDAAVIVDALFGAGLSRPLDGEARRLVEAINAAGAAGAVVIAVDLPSGISGETGAVLGAAVRATETVTFFRRKPGHLLLPGRLHCGRVRVADIGIADGVLETVAPQTFANEPDLWGGLFPLPRIDGHKYSRGHAVVVSGGAASTGAARLAARAALRAGAGLVTLASPPDAVAINAAATLAVMVRPVDGPQALAAMLQDRRLNAVLLGPGGGVGARLCDQVAVALDGDRAVVLDADALTSFKAVPQRLNAAIAQRSAATVLTPHAGEFARLFGPVSEGSKLDATLRAARESHAVVVLKGPDTVVAAPDGRAAIAANAPPFLATAGTGDVLAGMITGLLAQGMPAFEAAAAAVWLHGEAGTEAGPGLIAEDLTEVLPAVYRRLFAHLAGSR